MNEGKGSAFLSRHAEHCNRQPGRRPLQRRSIPALEKAARTYRDVQGDLYMNLGGITKLSSRYARLSCSGGSFFIYIRGKKMKLENIISIVKPEFIWFHQHPELSGEEYETTKRIKSFLNKYKIPTYDLPDLETGLVAYLGNGQGPTVAIRCDIDALPLEEKSGVPYCSLIKGKMHACGHDFHTATLMGIALALKDESINGTIQLIFQPAEENLKGSREILKTNILKNTDVIFGLHCSAMYKRGTIITRPGAMHGSTASFKITFHGKGAHACRPQLSIDPVIMTSQFVVNAQTIISRNINPFHAALLSITHIDSGTNSNIIPDSGYVEGTARTVSEKDKEIIKHRLETLSAQIASAYGGNIAFRWFDGSPATNNNPEWAEFAEKIAILSNLPFQPAPDNL